MKLQAQLVGFCTAALDQFHNALCKSALKQNQNLNMDAVFLLAMTTLLYCINQQSYTIMVTGKGIRCMPETKQVSQANVLHTRPSLLCPRPQQCEMSTCDLQMMQGE